MSKPLLFKYNIKALEKVYDKLRTPQDGNTDIVLSFVNKERLNQAKKHLLDAITNLYEIE